MTNPFQRILELEGGCNLRDLGGYPTRDGRTVASGKLYRSGVMTYLTEADTDRIRSLGIRVVCDLRRSRERSDEPTHWINESVTKFSLDEDPSLEGRGELSWRNAKTAEAAREVMINLYRNMPVWLESRLRGIFDHLASSQVPLLFHCAAGKDRTGLAAALILHSLGVDRDTILADYTLTNQAVDLEKFLLKHRFSRLGLSDDSHPLLQIPLEIRKATMMADAAYLSAALDRIEYDHHSIDNYLRDRFGVTADRQRDMRNLLLTESE